MSTVLIVLSDGCLKLLKPLFDPKMIYLVFNSVNLCYCIRLCKKFTIAEKSQTLIFILLFDHLVISPGIHPKTHYPFPEAAVEVVIHHENLH